MALKAIAAMSANRVIGHKGLIPWHLPQDFAWFKQMTMGGTLIMGRKTFEAIGTPLPGRKTMVLSRSRTAIPGVEVYPTIDALPKTQHPCWVCGGSDIYRGLLAACTHLYLTRVHRQIEGDTYFPEFENTFKLDGLIHQAPDFQVERWSNNAITALPSEPLEPWSLL